MSGASASDLLIAAACRSHHLVKGVLGVPSVESYSVDMCSDGRCPHVYPKVCSVRERWANMGERCPVCGTHRYQKRNNQLQPVRR